MTPPVEGEEEQLLLLSAGPREAAVWRGGEAQWGASVINHGGQISHLIDAQLG